MSKAHHQILLVTATFLLSLVASTSHATLVFTNGVKANFRFTPVDGNVLNLPTTPLDFEALGSMTFSLDDSVANATSMAFTNATGLLTVTSPPPFSLGAIMGPHEFVSGQFENITRDGLGNITGGNVVGLRMRWEMFFNGLRLYTVDSLPFNGLMTGAPFQIGDVLEGPDPFNVYLETGAGPSGDPLVVIGSNRLLTITAVPEPSSLALMAVIGLGYAAFRVRRSKPIP